MLALAASLLAALPFQAPSAELENLEAAVDGYLAPLVETGAFSGTVLLARGDEVLVERAVGFADFEAGVANTLDTGFKLMSVSKSLCGVTVMRLVEEELLSLDDPVAQHLPNWPEAWSEVTVQHLADHTSGIPNLERVWSGATWRRAGEPEAVRGLGIWKKIAAETASVALEAEAGARHRYSNFNYELLGAVIESVTDARYPAVLRERVLEPAGMARTGIDDGTRREGLSVGYFRRDDAPDRSQQDMSRIQAAGGVYSTARDLWRLDRALASGALLSAENREAMVTPTAGSYAVGWSRMEVHGRPAIHHSGGSNGYVAYLLRLPDEDACIVAMSNLAYAPITRVAHDLAGLFLEEDIASPRVAAAEELDGAVGVYRAAEGWPLSVIRRSGSLLVSFDLWSGNAERTSGRLLTPVGASEFVPGFGDERRRFEKGTLILESSRWTRTLDRIEDGRTAWIARAGSYVTPGSPAQVTKLAGEPLTFTAPGGRPPFRVLPVTDDLAIALFGQLGGTLLKSEGEALRWFDPGLGWVHVVPAR